MIKIIGKSLYQWDLDRQIEIDNWPDGTDITEVNFAHPGDEEALVVHTKQIDEKIVADIPNICLQRHGTLVCYLCKDNMTISSKHVRIHAREKPTDYVYTETEREDYKIIAENYNKNIHYEQTVQAVNDTLKPLADTLSYMTYRKRDLVSSVDSETNPFLRIDEDTRKLIIPFNHDPEYDYNLQRFPYLEMEIEFALGSSTYAYGAHIAGRLVAGCGTQPLGEGVDSRFRYNSRMGTAR